MAIKKATPSEAYNRGHKKDHLSTRKSDFLFINNLKPYEQAIIK